MSSEHDHSQPDEVEVVLSDLRSDTPPRGAGNRRSAGQRLLLRSGVLVALALVVAALLYRTPYAGPALPRTTATPTGGATFLPLMGMGCVRDAAWDPSSTFIALVGPSDTDCGYTSYSPNVVNIYRARTGTLMRQLHPDPALFTALGLPQPVPVTPTSSWPPQPPTLMYQTLRWSPDGTRLALDFAVLTGLSAGQGFTGLVLLDADGQHQQVLVNRQTGPQPAYTVWDLQKGTTLAVGSAPTSSTYTPNVLPAALSYTWGNAGTLLPSVSLSANSAPPPTLDLVGNPDGGDRFGLWQPGQIEVFAVKESGRTAATYLDLYTTVFAAWSPSGRYFVDQLNMSGLLLSSRQVLPPRSVLSTVQLDQEVGLPIRDAALQQALTHDIPLPVSLALNPPMDVASLAWRPDGKVLAITNQANGFDLRASATGRIVLAVPVIEIPSGYPGPFVSLAAPLWSPDGAWLLLPSLALVRVGHLNL